METVKDPNDTIVSQKAFTNLLRIKKTKVDDEKWMNLLESMQSTYELRSGRRRRADSSADAGVTQDADDEDAHHGHEQPLVVVRNTRNQVLSYEITFAEHGDVGLELQSDFYGHCLTVKSISGEAAKHPIIQKHDIIAAIDDNKQVHQLTYDQMANSKEEENARVARGMSLLKGDCMRRITFQRQESYFQYDDANKTLALFLRSTEEVPPGGKFLLQLPTGCGWTPTDYVPGNEEQCLQVQFEVPLDEELDFTTVTWNPTSESVEVTLQGEVAIAANSSVVMQVIGLDCGANRLVGPCELLGNTLNDPDGNPIPTLFVSLFTDWSHREPTIQRNPVRERTKRVDEYLDKSLEPIRLNFEPGESGITLASDFFGQCAVVEKVKDLSQAANFGIQPNDILTSIAVVENDSLDCLNCIKPFAMKRENAEAHIKGLRTRLTNCHKSGRMYRLQFLRLKLPFFL
ncbi:hypothetical protein PINS_up001738 [Pythium insidiosum]|nr:hypothetical protein PINS_up001738 [Pythium insidiosum]